MSKIVMSLRIDEEVKKEASDLFSALGMDLPSAINIFLRQCVLRHGLPFAVALPEAENENKRQQGGDTMDINNNHYIQSMKFGQKDGQVFCALRKSTLSVFGAHLISAGEAIGLLEGAEHYILSQPEDDIVCIRPAHAEPDRIPMPLEKAIIFAFSRLDISPGGDSYPDYRDWLNSGKKQ